MIDQFALNDLLSRDSSVVLVYFNTFKNSDMFFFSFILFFSRQRISQRAKGTSLEKQLDPMGPSAS